MHRIKSCWLKSILTKWTCLLPSLTTTKPILCRLCWPSEWARKSDGIDPAQSLRGSGPGVASSILRFRLSRPQFPHSSVMSVKPILSASPHCAAALQKRLRQSRTAMRAPPVVGRSIDEIKLPPGTIIGAVVRGNDVMIANNNLRIEQGDHVIMFLTDKKFISDVERLFQPSPFFL